ncbi:hypothetical protein SASPL_127642 [Salvia splendens]|uniref:Uncharacterized protein n=1 Tax=Salvia splendens TaxID=180675 RepID=A0A8X8ZLR4_SALSN|nr:hypothetical protein SASPL_127642 [Salvia splendens]
MNPILILSHGMNDMTSISLNPGLKQSRGIGSDSSLEIEERLSIRRMASSGFEENGVEDEEDKEVCGSMIRHSEFEKFQL